MDIANVSVRAKTTNLYCSFCRNKIKKTQKVLIWLNTNNKFKKASCTRCELGQLAYRNYAHNNDLLAFDIGMCESDLCAGWDGHKGWTD